MNDLTRGDRRGNPVPLVVDCDGTLIRSDLLVESGFAYIGSHPFRTGKLFGALMRGKHALKSAIAAEIALDVTTLPYDPRVLDLVRDARQEGRKTYLASANNERYVKAIADHLGLFDGWFASDDGINLSSHNKARLLVDTFGERGFDYVGNDRPDVPIWRKAGHSIAVHPSSAIRREVRRIDTEALIFEAPGGSWRMWLKMLRVHQWVKNGLVLVPLITAQAFTPVQVLQGLIAFLAFSLAASSIYIINDLVDLEADRAHPTKRNRPLAAGRLSILQALCMAPILLFAALGIALAVNWQFTAVLVGYVGLTTAYSFSLKRKTMVDIVALAALYTIRVVGGAAAITVPISEWLLAFSMFIFTALALVKRYIELASRLDANLPDPSNRNYRKADLSIVAALACGAGMNAIVVFALYISSDTTRELYRHPHVLWLICPILLYWLGRLPLLAHRRLVHDDPIVFALKDRNSWLAGALVAAIMVAAK